MISIHLKSGKDRPVRQHHPWIFSGAIRAVDLAAEPGSLVRVLTADGEFLGVGYVNPRCDIAVRLLSRGDEAIDSGFVRRRAERALALRRRVIAADTTAYRLINGEGDHLPGLVVDRYEDVLVLQCLTAGAEQLKPLLLQALVDLVAPRAIVERSEGSVRHAEGLPARSGTLYGDPPDEVTVRENGLRMIVAPTGGQKTGYFCDQRPNRALLRDLARGQRVLDACAYSGGFAVHAGTGGAAHVVAVDSSAGALEVARRNWASNGLPEPSLSAVHADVRRFLRESEADFDLIVLDPPALVKQRRDRARGARAYKDLNLWALRRAAPGAFLLTFTCSPHVDRDHFRKIVAAAASDARRSLQLLQHLAPGPDHPVALAHPEGEHLHGVLARVE